MDVVTAEEMRAFDRETIERLGIPAIALMENAGRAIAEEVIALCRRRGAGAGGGTGSADAEERSFGAGAVGGVGGGRQSYGAGPAGGESEGTQSYAAGGPAVQPPGFSVSADPALALTAAGGEHW
ncbi:bifunctional ADP-dependent NAD(P)H-hydrate dehydratase/NAD(P)H-hydrate epimerase, partial [Paenibacillus phytohabitans]